MRSNNDCIAAPRCPGCGEPAERWDNEFDEWAEFACGSDSVNGSMTRTTACATIHGLREVIARYDEANHALQMERDLLGIRGCVDCSKDADATCPECDGPWCRECKEAMGAHPCHTCRSREEWG